MKIYHSLFVVLSLVICIDHVKARDNFKADLISYHTSKTNNQINQRACVDKLIKKIITASESEKINPKTIRITTNIANDYYFSANSSGPGLNPVSGVVYAKIQIIKNPDRDMNVCGPIPCGEGHKGPKTFRPSPYTTVCYVIPKNSPQQNIEFIDLTRTGNSSDKYTFMPISKISKEINEKLTVFYRRFSGATNSKKVDPLLIDKEPIYEVYNDNREIISAGLILFQYCDHCFNNNINGHYIHGLRRVEGGELLKIQNQALESNKARFFDFWNFDIHLNFSPSLFLNN